jgi:AraC-like DNA-binding protein
MGKIPGLKASTKLELCKRLQRGRDFLLSSYDQPLRLDEIARQACLSPYHFHRSFTRFFGKTPHRYLTDYRLARAAAQLRNSSRRVTDLCIDCGFESLPSFINLFRRCYTMSPREYRREMARNSKLSKIG